MKRPLAGVLTPLLALATAGGLLVAAPGPVSAAPGWTPPRVVADDMRTGFGFVEPRVAVNRHGDAVITWECDGLCVRVRHRDGGLGPLVRAGDADGGFHWTREPLVDDQGRVTVLWSSYAGGGPFQAQQLDADDRPGEPVVLDPAEADASLAAVNRAGDVLVAWTAGAEHRVRLLRPDGTLGPTGSLPDLPHRVLAAPDGSFVLVGRTGDRLWVRPVVDGVVGEPQAPTERPTGFHDAAFLADGSLAFLWWQRTPAGDDLVARRWRAEDGFGEPAVLAAEQDQLRDLRLHTLGDGRVVVTWARGQGLRAGVLPVAEDAAFTFRRISTKHLGVHAARNRLVLLRSSDRPHRVTVRTWDGTGEASARRHVLVDPRYRKELGLTELAAASAGGPVVLVNHREMALPHRGRDAFATMWVTVRR
ncbi:hypothetical protein QWY28_00360 [Nocardioides sp. SOB77]|uniref:WD40 repeat domain-containing protein n=1 Tax=Nocardioides oceani TaxID=3058369 RepID=A0ABT8FB26_9ACTN|nr:hypothetical protein [Nocardioides oceani]MDN4171387.1 hypothetical protein [Nocardioides oceani]